MTELTLQRIPFTKDADNRMRALKARTGITPNYFCRLGFCLSLDEPGTPSSPAHDAEQGREINRFTLLGEYDTAFVSLLKVWMNSYGLELGTKDEFNALFVAHMNRGIELITSRVKTLADIGNLVAGAR
jgi:DNA sulfur modification protein DndE